MLLEVAASRVTRVRAADALARYRHDRFSRPASVPFRELRSVEDAFVSAVPSGWDWVVPSPLVPFGAHAALGEITQDWLVSTLRPNEVAADPTVALALEAAVDRGDTKTRRDLGPTRLATIQRITRAQRYDSPDAFTHFSIFGAVTAGRSQADDRFDDEALSDHVGIYVEALSGIASGLELTLSTADTVPGRRLRDGLRERWTSDRVQVADDPERIAGQRYYRRACFKIHALIGGARLEFVDGGFTDWTERLLADRHERMLISGAGLDRPASALAQGESP